MVLKHRIKKIPMNFTEEEAARLIQELLERFPALTQAFKNFGDAAKRSTADFKKSIEDLNKDIKKGRAGFADQLRMLENLNDALEDLEKQVKSTENLDRKTQLEKQRSDLLDQAARRNVRESLQQFGEELTNNVTQSSGRLVRQLQVGASGTELSSDLMNTSIDAMASGTKLLGKGLTSLGMKFEGTPVLGGILQLAGTIVEGIGEAGSKALKFANEVLAKELIKTEKAFNATNAAGAVFAQGMTGMREASVDAGLTLQQFSNVISKQSADLAFSGMGVAEGARKVGQVGKIFDANNGQIRKQLQRLGFGFEEQAEITATVMANIRRTGQSFNTATLASETQKYAENLRLISALTGEDAKAKIKQVEEQNNIAAFQAKIAELGPEQANRINQAMATMTELEKKNFRDRVVFNGAVINEEGAMKEASNRVAAEQGKEIYLKFLAGAFDIRSVAEIQGKYSQASIEAFKNNQAMNIAGMAAGDAKITAVQQDQLAEFQRAQKITKDGVAGIIADIQSGKQPGDELTDGFITASTAAQKLAVGLEDKILPLLSEYADTTGVMLAGMQKIIETIYGKVTGSTPEKAPFASSGSPGFPQLSPNPVIPITRSGSTSQKTPAVSPQGEGKAQGGISRGPVSGYSEILHGTEAVVPLPDNRSIPVSMDSSSITAAVNQQSGILAEILRAMQNNNSISSQIAMNTV
jgi:hypothetical protein